MDEVKDTAQGSIDVAEGVKDDIIQLDFYKNPIFITFSIYIIVILGIYFNMSNTTKNKLVFSDKFRDSNDDIHWADIIYYPYDFSKSLSNKIKIVISSPILLYLMLGIYLTVTAIDPLQKRHQAYFYSIMFSYLFIVILFAIHIIIFNFIISPEKTNIELRLGDSEKVQKTYASFYKTQWILLIVFVPIILSLVIYIIRKLNKDKLTN